MGADGAALFIPYVTGLGIAARISAKTAMVTTKVVNYSSKVTSALKNTSALRTALNITNKLYEAHHIIPKSLLEKSKVVQDAVEAGFKFNDDINGISVKTFTKAGEAAGDAGQHANHPTYTKNVLKNIDNWANQAKKDGTYSPENAKKFLEGFSNKLKNKIQKESNEGGKKVNNLTF